MKYPDIDPVAISIGSLDIHWYGLMYLVGFAAAWWLATVRANKPGSGWTANECSDFIFYGAVGVILGGRIGYQLFYNLDGLLRDPLALLRLWEGGMSFHGGAIGVLIAFAWFAHKTGKSYFQVADYWVPMVPIGLGTGRIGNFINGELWGRQSDVSWAMVFPGDPSQLARHPSQLYQAALEGLALFLLLWFFSAKPRPAMAVTGLFGVGYGSFRTIVEFFREPDAHIGYLAFGWLTMGQLLSIPMILIGAGMMFWAYRHQGAAKS